jgi:superfamily II DNA or RNA helicase
MIPITVDNRIRVPLDELDADTLAVLQEAFTHKNPMHEKLKRLGFGRGRFAEPKTYVTFALEENAITFPLGGLGRVRKALRDGNHTWTIIDSRMVGTGPRGIPEHRVPNGGTLWDFQQELVDRAQEVQVCLCRAPTGSGKTTGALAFAAAVDLPTLVIVWNRPLFEQWIRRAEVELGISRRDIGRIQGSTMKIAPLTIGMQQTVCKRIASIRDVFGVVIADEVQRFASKTFFGTIDKLRAKYKLGISASEHRRDRKEFLIYDVFGDVVVDIAEGELIDRGIVHDVEVRVVPTSFTSPWYAKLVEKSEAEIDESDPDAVSIRNNARQQRSMTWGRMIEDLAVDVERNKLAVRIAFQAFERGEQVVLLSHRREHAMRIDADIFATGHRCGLLLGTEENAEAFEDTCASIIDGSLRFAAGTYQAFGTGIDVPSLGVGVAMTPIANSSDGRMFFGQVRGRLCRTSKATGKTGATLYYLWDGAIYGDKPLKNLRRWNRTVSVLDGDEWIPVVEYLRRRKAQHATTK